MKLTVANVLALINGCGAIHTHGEGFIDAQKTANIMENQFVVYIYGEE
jgi:hypothetical protein